jgi:hypothetical protein
MSLATCASSLPSLSGLPLVWPPSGQLTPAAFFMPTGLHGLHVTMGAIMLTVIWFRTLNGHFTPTKHFAFEALSQQAGSGGTVNGPVAASSPSRLELAALTIASAASKVMSP